MLAIFHGWRRKIGVITLVMACVFMAGWVRSFGVRDLIGLRLENIRTFYVQSDSGSLFYRDGCWSGEWDSAVPFWSTAEANPTELAALPLQFCGFRHRSFWDEDEQSDFNIVWVPYWMIVIPLTLLSAWLLLIKPRPKPNQTDDKSPTPSPH